MSEAKKKKTLKEIPEEELAQISGGTAYYETKWVVTEGNTDINQQGGGVSGSNNGGKTNWEKGDQVILQLNDKQPNTLIITPEGE